MKLEIRNIGILQEANIELDAVTVIAGANSTGKSTVGKIIYALVAGVYEITPAKILLKKTSSIGNSLGFLRRRIEVSEDADLVLKEMSERIRSTQAEVNELMNWPLFNEEELEEIHHRFTMEMGEQLLIFEQLIKQTIESENPQQSLFENHVSRIKNILQTPIDDESLKFDILQDIFQIEFNQQICNIKQKEEGMIRFIEKNNNYLNLFFKDDEIIKPSSEIKVNQDFSIPVYIDNPSILDTFTERKSPSFRSNDWSYHRKNQLKNLVQLKKNTESDIFNAKETKDLIEDIFSSVIKGKINVDGPDKYYQMSQDDEERLSLLNLSTGMKSFSILSVLKDSGAFENTEYVILDEPEIHLHPDWQLKYAKLIILLSKHFNIKFLITSHSPYFIEAIELYSKMYKVDRSVKYYLSVLNEDENISKISDCTDDLDHIYDELAAAMFDLSSLRDEIEEGEINGTNFGDENEH